MKNDGNNMSIIKNLLTSSRLETRLLENHLMLTKILEIANILSPEDEAKVRRNVKIYGFFALAKLSAVATPIWIIASNPVATNLVFGAFFPILAIPTLAWTRRKEVESIERIIDRYMVPDNIVKMKDLLKETDHSVDYNQIIDEYVENKSARN